MASDKVSAKHLIIEQNSTLIFLIVGVAAAVLSFTIVSGISLGQRFMYQNRVIDARNKAADQIEKNNESVQTLKTSFNDFDGATESVIGTADRNSKIILDALPSKYDFPALAASIDKLVKLTNGLRDVAFSGTDNEATAQQSSADPQPIEIPISISGNGNYESIQKLILNIQASIRPIKINNLSLSGSQDNMSFAMSLTTYYMPAKVLEINSEEIK